MVPEQGTSGCAELSLILEPDSEDTLVDPFGCQEESFFPEVAGELAVEFLRVPDDENSADGDTTSCFVQDAETYVIGSESEEEGDDEDMDECGEEDPTVMMSNRQSTLSSFTGASLLASPQYSVFGVSSVASPIEDGAVNLLSPVQLSAKLRPFPIPSLGSKVKRGDSIDSGYADGDSWVSPLPFPRSPPRSFRSPVTFLSHSRQVSHSSPAFQDRRVSYDINALRPSPHPIEVIKEVESDDSSEDNEDIAYTILGAYDTSPSEEQRENEACDPLQVNVAVVAEEKAEEEEELSKVPAVLHSLRRPHFQRNLPTEDMSDISKVSVLKRNSLLSSVSGCSTPNTSVLSHYSDANELLEQPISIHARASLLTSLPRQRKLLPRGDPCLGGVFVSMKRSLISSPSMDTSGSLSSAKDILGYVPLGADDLQEFAPGNLVALQEHMPAVLHYDRRSPKSSPSAESSYSPSSYEDVLGYAAAGAGDIQELASENVAPQKRLSGVLCFDKRPPNPGSSAGSSRSANGKHTRLPANAVAPREHLSTVLHFDKHLPNSSPSTESSLGPSSVRDTLGYAVPSASDMPEFAPENVVPQGRLSGISHFDNPSLKSSSLAESSRSPFSGKDMYAPRDVDDNDSRSPEPSTTVLHDRPAECAAAEAGQSLVVENSLGSDEITESLDSECDDFTQRLSFPLPPSLSTEFVGHSTLSGNEETPVLSEAAVTNLEKDASNGCTVLQCEDMQRILSGSDLTEKVGPSRLPSRAASDLTVKGRSPPVTVLGHASYISRSPPPPLEQLGRFDSVQSLYDQYFDDGISDDSSEFPSPAHKDTTSPDVSSPIEEPFQDVHLQSVDHTPHVFRRVTSPSSDSKTSNSDTDSPRSETALRPLLIGRRSFPYSSLAELVPEPNHANAKESSSRRHQSTRLQVRGIGSTMVPLGFRRHKPQPAAIQSSQPLDVVLPASALREVLRIRTDIVEEDLPPGCSSAIHVPSATRSPLTVKPMSAPPTGGLRQLRLSSIIDKRSSTFSSHSSSIASSILSLDHMFNSSALRSPSVSSTTSFSRNSSLSSSCERIPEHIHHTPKRTSFNSPNPQAADDACSASQSSSTRRDSRSVAAPIQQPKSWRLSHYRAGSRNYTSADGTHRFSTRSSTLSLSCITNEEREIEEHDSTISRPIQPKHEDNWTRPASVLAVPVHAIATPKPTLLFAIASDNVDQVRQVLESGEAGPNDSVGPQSALAFTLTNDKLAHKQDIVKALLAYGANPSTLRNLTLNPAPHKEGGHEPTALPPETTVKGMDPATRYFVARADAAHTRQTSQLIYRSFFRPLTRVRYDLIGQDWALEQLFRVLGMHSRKLAVAPIVVLLCGPSGHGKSLLARKFGSLLDVPTHTVNMTTLQSTHDIWQSYFHESEPSSCTLAEFLSDNEGKRCVVVLDEIEKVEDQKALWSLLMPWELGRCSFEAGKRHVDARNVIWLGTSNIGHELVFAHHENRAEPDNRMSQEEYLELTGMLRPYVSRCLGASLVSRVTAVLPFVPFSLDEKKAISAEAVHALSGEAFKMSPQDVESLVMKALPSYHPSEGARSLHRAISNILIDET
ncbi:hypothetical protein J3R82DRAFT_5952 [Butyriboletus roseoflavus]|nr:hypothetical protein J3R82DRAFT_5952 [Butyriboletus roseoflavus]